MAAKGVKKRDHEKLDDTTIERVITLLNDEKPISKKDACEILNISYNTTRLKNIIEEYEEKVVRRKKNFDKTKGTPLTDSEISNIILSFLKGNSVSDISEYTFRSSSVIKRLLENIGVPDRAKGDELHKPAFLPDECVLEKPPTKGTILWSAKYHTACEIMSEFHNNDASISYLVYVHEPTECGRRGGFYAYQSMVELGSLEHLSKYISLKQLTSQK